MVLITQRIRWIGVWLMILVGVAAGSYGSEIPEVGTVTLSLADYQSLTADVAAADDERRRRAVKTPSSIDWTSQRLEVEIKEGHARLEMTLGVQVIGRPDAPRKVPFLGYLEDAVAETTDGKKTRDLVVMPAEHDGWQIVAAGEGNYRLRLRGRVRMPNRGGASSLVLPKIEAPVAALEVTLSSELDWSAEGAVLVEQRMAEGRALLSFAADSGGQPKLELRPRFESEAAEKLLAQAVVAVVVQLRPEGWRRHDVVLYDVSRGGLDRFDLTLPPSLVVDEAATDEGPRLSAADEGRLTLHRGQRLSETGYAVVSSSLPRSTRSVELATLDPGLEVRATYLAVAGSVAADVVPGRTESWDRADLSDLPGALREALGAVDLVAAWRLGAGQPAGALSVTPLPEVQARESVVRLRDSTTLMTVDGTLLHRDRVTLSPVGAALELDLPPGTALWSVKVAEQGVRPLERAGRLTIPLTVAGHERAEVEIVTVADRAIPPGRSKLDLELPRFSQPVLEQRWLLLLPEQARYRFRDGSLRPSLVSSVPGARVIDDTQPLTTGESGTHLSGFVRDTSGDPLPGARVIVSPGGQRRTVITDERGRYMLLNVEPGETLIQADLEGFSTTQTMPRIRRNRINRVNFTLSVSSAEETIVVTGELPSVLASSEVSTKYDFERVSKKNLEDRRAAQASQDYREQASGLRQGLVGGVRPLPVTIPETGKALLLTGILPAERVAVSLDVKARR